MQELNCSESSDEAHHIGNENEVRQVMNFDPCSDGIQLLNDRPHTMVMESDQEILPDLASRMKAALLKTYPKTCPGVNCPTVKNTRASRELK